MSLPQKMNVIVHAKGPQSRKLLALFSLCIALGACAKNSGVNSTDPINDDTEGIVRGKAVTSTDKLGKSVVAIVAQSRQGQALCTGSIIAVDTILTAAHCVDNSVEQLILVFNSDVSRADSANIRRALSFAQNPRWNRHSPDGRGDLALIHFSGGLPAGYQPVKLTSTQSALSPGREVVMLGYGVSNGLRETGSGHLRKTKTTVLGSASETEVATDGRISSVCFGDSGGPAFVESGKTFLQWGVASSVLNKACNEASIHTSVAPYGSWIKATALKLRSYGKNKRTVTETN